MRENPYASPKSDVSAVPEVIPSEPMPIVFGENPYLRPLFTCRKFAMLAMGSVILFGPVIGWMVWSLDLPIPFGLLPVVLSTAEFLALASVVVFVVATIGCWICLFLAGQRHGGLGYAIGHVLSSILLTPILLVGILVVPLQVRGDVERAAEAMDVSDHVSRHELPDG